MTLAVGRPVYGGGFRTSCEGAFGPETMGVLPGEIVSLDHGRLAVLEASPQRIAPGCLHFGACGGCHYQQAEAEVQREWKREIMEGLLAAAVPGSLPAAEIVAGKPWGYRNRIRLRLRLVAGEGLQVGYSRRASNDFLPIVLCPIAAPVLWKAALALQAVARDAGVQRAACLRWLGAITEVECLATADERHLQLSFSVGEVMAVRNDAAGFATLCERLRGLLPELEGAGATAAPEASRRTRRAWDGMAWGRPGLAFAVAGESYWISRGAFFQVNRFLLPALVELVAQDHMPGPAWDLFAGVGLFTRALATRGHAVVAVEGAPAAAADLAAGSTRRGAPAYRAVHASAADFLRGQQTQRERPALVVVDPPRAGLGEAAELLARIAPASVVYVSCDPMTLARDLGVLVRAGYRVERRHLVDLFPQTYHIETVVRLTRRA